jgi:hypothetical protein
MLIPVIGCMTKFSHPCCRLIAIIADLVREAISSVTGSTLGDAATLGGSCTLGDDDSVFVSNMDLSCRSADVAVVIVCALVVGTVGLLNTCVSASAAMMAASSTDKVGVEDSCGKKLNCVQDTFSLCSCDVASIASVVLHGRPQIPPLDAVRIP